jgi:nucleoid DNA-binding protein
MTKNDLKKDERRRHNPKAETKVPSSRVIVFKASAILNQRVNRYSAEKIVSYLDTDINH